MRKLPALLSLTIFMLGLFITGCETKTTTYCRVIYDCYGFVSGGTGAVGGSRPVDPKNYTLGMEAIILDNTFQYPNHKFKNWNTQSDGKSDSYNPGEKLLITDHYLIHLYAIWEPEGQ